MPKYLFEISYTVEGIKGVAELGGTARKQVAETAAKSVGGSVEAFYFAFGGTDVFCIMDLPDNQAATAVALTVSASGGATARTVVLLTPEDVDATIGIDVEYRPPGR